MKRCFCSIVFVFFLFACGNEQNPATTIPDHATLMENGNRAINDVEAIFIQIQAIMTYPVSRTGKGKDVDIQEKCDAMHKVVNGYDRPGGNTLTYSQVTDNHFDALLMLHDVCNTIAIDYRIEEESIKLERNAKTKQENTPYRTSITATQGDVRDMKSHGASTSKAIDAIMLDANNEYQNGSVDIDRATARLGQINEIMEKFIISSHQQFRMQKITRYTFISLYHGPGRSQQAKHDTAIAYEQVRDRLRSLQIQARILLIQTALRLARQVGGTQQ